MRTTFRPARGPWLLVAAVALVAVGLLAWQLWPRSPAERVARAIRAHGSCADVEVVRQPHGAAGAARTALPVAARSASAVTSVICDMAGGTAELLTFGSVAARVAATSSDREARRVTSCPAGRELLVDAELEGTSSDACAELGGRIVRPKTTCRSLPARSMATTGYLLTSAEERRLDRERHGGPCAFGTPRP